MVIEQQMKRMSEPSHNMSEEPPYSSRAQLWNSLRKNTDPYYDDPIHDAQIDGLNRIEPISDVQTKYRMPKSDSINWQIELHSMKLDRLIPVFAAEGWDDVELWKEITDEDLKEMGARRGDIVKWNKHFGKLKSQLHLDLRDDVSRASENIGNRGTTTLVGEPNMYSKFQIEYICQ